MRVTTLGELAVDGRPVKGARLAAVVRALIDARGRAVSVGALVDAVWDVEPPDDAPGAVQALVSRARRLGLPVTAGPGGYLVPAEAVEVDVVVARALLDGGRRALDGGDPEAATAAARQARALIPEVPDLAADTPGSSLVRLLADVAALDAEATLAAGRPAQEADLRRLVAHRPPHEPSAALLVRVLAAQGRDAEALDVVERLRAELADGYGADPSPAVEAVHVALLRGELTPRAAPKITLPAGWRRAVTALVGREQDVTAVLAALDAAPLVTVVAAGGAGKTRLAAEVARRVAAGGRAVTVVELAGLRTSAEVLPAVLAAVSAADPGGGRPEWRSLGSLERLRLVVPELHGLVVLDNCEHVLEGAAGAAAELLAAPDLAVLATSRAPLSLPGEVAHRLTLPDEAALDLLDARVRAGGAAPCDPAAALELCHRLDNLPLALELAAARLRHMPIGDVLAGLADRFGLLDDALRGLPDRHASLWAMVDWSRELLGDGDRALLERLAVIPAPFTADLAGAVAGSGDARRGLAALVEQSLLSLQADEDGVPRYRMLETVREYGEVRLDAAGTRDAAMTGLTRWAAQESARLATRFVGAGQLAAFQRCATEQDNLVAALRWALAHEDDAAAVNVMGALAHLWTVRGLHTEVVTWTLRVFRVDDPAAQRHCALLHGEAAVDAERATWLCLFTGLNAFVVDTPRLFALVLRTLRALAPRRDEVSVQAWTLASALRALSSPDLDVAVRAAGDLVGDPDPYVQGFGYFFRSMMHENRGALAESIADAALAYQRFEEVGDHWGMGTSAQIIGGRGGPDAHEWLRHSERHMDLLGAAEDLSSIRIMLDARAAFAGDTAAADRLRVAARAADTHESDVGLANLVLGQLALAHGEHEEAVTRAARVLAAVEEIPAGVPQVRVLYRSAVAVLFLRLPAADPDRAAQLLRQGQGEALSTYDIPVLGAWALAGSALAAHLGEGYAAELWTLGVRLGGNVEHLFPDGAGVPAVVEDSWKWHERPVTEATDRLRALMSDLLAVGGEG
ncbi:transcriptional regulator [Dactylosporangium sp. NBC_01737]|uniref:BTAD domain-containing putative transcriptional regulator n=1 Tax=Dactylosporangium sp. NBC_01737 TaxID=2975959 RepID=UPI002E0FEFE1|nr:transcriptional regulator [Dactylosporangium sp. NBC_01737]